MQLGFVSAILGDLPFEDVLAFAADEGFACVEPMCWPPGGSDRRYAGVCHIDVSNFTDEQAGRVRDLVRQHGVALSGLGYYPNPLDPNPEHRRFVLDHLKKVIAAAPKLGARVVNTFIGRDHTKSVEANWPAVREVWPDVVRQAERAGVVLGLENCPMLFTQDEWPGGKNLAVSPALWSALFEELPGPHVGLNFDPSHLIWQHIDYVRCARQFGPRIVHVHAKDTRIDPDKLYQTGILGLGWHTAKLPGLGDVDWGALFAALTDVGYRGPVCIEVEDRAYEGSLADRQRALRQSKRYLEQFVGP
ncbi:MAG TPA: sugar phosphate isomerase/epimerase [Gemmataceae bacterium]|nr:sugar phosphate isomerase/epimerase [Gemmataceae bacterium]